MNDHLICTVSTVKDTTDNVSAFVRRNLAAGVDHMFVFVDSGDPALLDMLAPVPHVTAVAADAAYLHGYSAPRLNERQNINANVANILLAGFPEVEWLFHIDGDECLDIDKEHLLALHSGVPAVSLTTLESAAKMRWEGEVNRFKFPPGQEGLERLARSGVIPDPRLRSYFHGHVGGKVGVRPCLDYRLGIHKCTDQRGQQLDLYRSAGELRVLHYEAYSAEEFVRKWTTHFSNRRPPKVNNQKLQMLDEIAAVMANSDGSHDNGVTEQWRQDGLTEIFRRHVLDDHERLEEMGLLMTPDLKRHQYQPQGFDPGQLSEIDEVLTLLCEANKEPLGRPNREQHVGPFVRDLRDHAKTPMARTRLDVALERCARIEG